MKRATVTFGAVFSEEILSNSSQEPEDDEHLGHEGSHEGYGKEGTSDSTCSKLTSDSKCSKLSYELRKHVMKLQHEVEDLFAKAGHRREAAAAARQQQRAKSEPDKAAMASAAAAHKEVKVQQGNAKKLNRSSTSHVREIKQQPRAPIHIDQPEDSDDEEGEDMATQAHENDEQDPSEEQSSAAEEDASDMDSSEEDAELIAETWDIKAARENVRDLLQKIHTDERLNVLEDLGAYYSQKAKVIEKDNRQNDRAEYDVDKGLTRLDDSATKVNEKIDNREVHTYMLLNRYYKTLHKRVRGYEANKEKAHIADIRGLLIEHVKSKHDGKRRKGLPAGVKPCDVLSVVADLQQEIMNLKSSMQIDTAQKAAYQHTLDFVMRNGVNGIEDDVVASGILKELREWIRESQKEAFSQRLSDKVISKEFECKQLAKECDTLRVRLEEYTSQIGEFMNKRKDRQTGGGECGEVSENDSNKKVTVIESNSGHDSSETKILDDSSEAPAPVPGLLHGSNFLFDEATSKEIVKEFNAQQVENTKIERQLAQFEELEGLAKQAQEALQEASKKFNETTSYARRNLIVGSLPPEAEDEDTKVLQDLRGFDEALDQKQEEEHKAAMSALKDHETDLNGQIAEAQKEIDRLHEKTSKEKTKQDRLAADIAALKLQQQTAAKELARLQELNPEEDQAKLDQLLEENHELRERVHQVRNDYEAAKQRESTQDETFSKATQAAAAVLSGLGTDVGKQPVGDDLHQDVQLSGNLGNTTQTGVDDGESLVSGKQLVDATDRQDDGVSATGVEVAVQEGRDEVVDGIAAASVPRLPSPVNGIQPVDVTDRQDDEVVAADAEVADAEVAVLEDGERSSRASGRRTVEAADRHDEVAVAEAELAMLSSRARSSRASKGSSRASGRQTVDATYKEDDAEAAAEAEVAVLEGDEVPSGRRRSSLKQFEAVASTTSLGQFDAVASTTSFISRRSTRVGGAGRERSPEERSPEPEETDETSASSPGLKSPRPSTSTSPRAKISTIGNLVKLKSGGVGWAQKARASAQKMAQQSGHPPEVQKLLEQEQRDLELAQQYSNRTVDLNRQISSIEAWVKKSKDVDIKQMVEALEQKNEAEVPSEVAALRQQVKKRKKLLTTLRQSWYGVRELAKRGARAQGTGREASDLRVAILNVCEDALAEAGRKPGQALGGDGDAQAEEDMAMPSVVQANEQVEPQDLSPSS